MEIISKKSALEGGLSRYYTGIPCKRKHLSERRTHNGTCIKCINEKLKSRRKKANTRKRAYETRKTSIAFISYKLRRSEIDKARRKEVNELFKLAFTSEEAKENYKTIFSEGKYEMEKIARMNAMNMGRKRYYTGVPCVHGHLSERLVNGYGCLACMAEKRKSVIGREKRKLMPCRRKKIIVNIKNHDHVEERKILT